MYVGRAPVFVGYHRIDVWEVFSSHIYFQTIEKQCFKNECECFIGVSKHEKIVESTRP